MTCKDCYHCEACENRFAGLKKICVDEPVKHLELNPAVEKCCENFKNKSRIIELPCKVGDEAYLISIKRYSPVSYKLVKAKVIGFNINRSGIYNVELKTLESDFTFTRHISKVHFDKSEAEAKLKELKK